MALATFISILFALIIIGLGAYLLYLIFGKPEEKPDDSYIIHNKWHSWLTGGHREGIGNYGKGVDRMKISFYPRDIRWNKYFHKGSFKEPKLPIYTIWFPREKLRHFASEHKNFLELLPLSVRDLDEDIKDTKMAKFLMQEVEDTNVEITEKDFIQRELEKTQGLIKLPFLGELSPEILERLFLISEDALKIAAKTREEKRTFTTGVGFGGTPSYGGG